MTIGLPVSRIVNVTSSFATATAPASNTSSLMIVTDAPSGGLISAANRSTTFSSPAAVATVFGLNSGAYLAANNYFSYNPQPQSVQVGYWASTAQGAFLSGGVLTAAQQAIANFNAITNGSLNITTNGTPANVTALNFAAAQNLNGVASTLQTALATIVAGTTVTWNGSNFVISSGTTGAGTQASDTATFTANPAANDTITINGVAITFVASAPTGNQVLIGTTLAATIQNLLTFAKASTNASLTALNYSATGTTFVITYPTVGTAGNAITVAKSSTVITLSGATLTGGTAASTITYATAGTGQDAATPLGLTAALAAPPVAGAAAESALAAVLALDNAAPYFFGLTFGTQTVQDSDHMAIAAYIEGTQHIYGVSTQETTALSPTVTTDIGSQLAAAGYTHTFAGYSSSTPYLAAAIMAIPLTVDYTQVGTANTVMFKQAPGVTPETLSTQQANTLATKRYNYFVNYNDGVAILQNGVMSGAAYVDEIVGVDSVSFNIQANEFTLFLQQPKVAQTDGGMALLTTVDEGTLEQYVDSGFLAAGHIWTGPSFGTLTYGMALPKGYYVYRAPIATQSVSQRAARAAVPAQIALGLAGAVQSSSVLINVNR